MPFDLLDADIFRDIFSVEVGLFTNAALLVVLLVRCWSGIPPIMAQWVAWRQQKELERVAREDARLKAKAADWERRGAEIERLSERLEAEIRRAAEQHKEQVAENERCHEALTKLREDSHAEVSALRNDLATERAERIKLRAVLDGFGEIRQAGAEAAAEARRDEREKREEGGS